MGLPSDDPIWQGPVKPGSSGYNWMNLVPQGVDFGLKVLGNRIASGPQRELTAWQKKQIEEEKQRRNMIQGMVAPTALRALGYRDPSQINQMHADISGNSLGSGGGNGYQVAPLESSTAGKVLGSIGGIGGTIAGGVMGGGKGAAIGGAAGGAILGGIGNQFGQGRRHANSFVQGVENQFGGDLARISTRAQTDPKGAAADFQKAYQNYQLATQNEIAKGGDSAKVAQQSLANPKLQQTVQTLARQLGVPI